jgi:hypothetical protein
MALSHHANSIHNDKSSDAYGLKFCRNFEHFMEHLYFAQKNHVHLNLPCTFSYQILSAQIQIKFVDSSYIIFETSFLAKRTCTTYVGTEQGGTFETLVPR